MLAVHATSPKKARLTPGLQVKSPALLTRQRIGGGGLGGGGGGEGGGAEGGTIPANWASSSRLMPLAVRKSVARSSAEHVSFPSPTATHLNGSTPWTLVLNEMAVWRPEMRSSFAVAGSGGQAGGEGGGGHTEQTPHVRAQ